MASELPSLEGASRPAAATGTTQLLERTVLLLLFGGLLLGILAVLLPFTTAILFGASLAIAAWPLRDFLLRCGLERGRGRELGFGAGIAQGYATLGQIGFAERSGYTAIGTVCNVAARLCAEAKDGQILLSQRVAVAIEGTTTLEEMGALTLKGLMQPVVAYNVPLATGQPAFRVIEGGPQSV